MQGVLLMSVENLFDTPLTTEEELATQTCQAKDVGDREKGNLAKPNSS